jgi:predicted metal-dependent phosphoesterase TrpH
VLKLDLHTHSSVSPDGGIGAEQYEFALSEDGPLDYMAITDHNTIALALQLQQQFPDKIIVGEEIMTTQGEIIGLFLTTPVKAQQSAYETAKAIKAQGGLVYIPHPFETVRSGITREVLDSIADEVDIIEVHNGRAVFQNMGPKAAMWAKFNRVAGAASSDAHGYKGLGTTYTSVNEPPTVKNLVKQLEKARLTAGMPPLRTLLYPKLNRLKKRWEAR